MIETTSYFCVAYIALRGLIAIAKEDDPMVTAMFALTTALMCCGVIVVARLI